MTTKTTLLFSLLLCAPLSIQAMEGDSESEPSSSEDNAPIAQTTSQEEQSVVARLMEEQRESLERRDTEETTQDEMLIEDELSNLEISHRTPKEFLEQYEDDLDQYNKALWALRKSFLKLKASGAKVAQFITSDALQQIAAGSPCTWTYRVQYLHELTKDKLVPSVPTDVEASSALCIQAITQGCAVIQKRKEQTRGQRDATINCIKLAEQAYSHLLE
jgi:hypothetical protein